jgi:TolB-like protein
MKSTGLIVILICISVTGCTVHESQFIKDGKEYGVTEGLFRHRWWNYFERGFSFAEGEFYQEAIEDFQSAIKRRADDQWRSRTYGLHFVNYFPHRELGVVYFRIKNYHDAERELEVSLRTAESAKAKYFLNKARAASLEESGSDRFPPHIRIDSPADRTITNKSSVTLNGEAEDDYFVSSLKVNGIPLPLELSAKKVSLQRAVFLRKGINAVKVHAADLTDKMSEKVLHITVDRDGPVIIIEDLVKKGRILMLSGFLTDATGITSFHINDRNIPLSDFKRNFRRPSPDVSVQELTFTYEIDLPEDTETVRMSVRDRAENITQGEVNINADSSIKNGPSPVSELHYMPLLAFADMNHPGTLSRQYASMANSLKKIFDTTPPVISLRDGTASRTVYTDSIFLEGSVSDKSGVVTLLINGEPVLGRSGKIVFFNYLGSLAEGENNFIIESVDAFGNRSEKTVSVTREIPKVRKLGSRMSISVLPFGIKGDQDTLERIAYDNLISAFVKQKRFQLVERKRIEDVLKELKLSQSELVDPDTASQVGRIVVADTILTGAIYETDTSLEILTRLVDTETSHILDTMDVYGEDKSFPGVKSLMEGLALKYKQSFPLVEGIILKKEGEAVLIDMGRDKKIKKDMGIILFREGEEVIHPATGKHLGTEPDTLGEAKVEDVYDEFSKASIRKGKASTVQSEDRVITK